MRRKREISIHIYVNVLRSMDSIWLWCPFFMCTHIVYKCETIVTVHKHWRRSRDLQKWKWEWVNEWKTEKKAEWFFLYVRSCCMEKIYIFRDGCCVYIYSFSFPVVLLIRKLFHFAIIISVFLCIFFFLYFVLWAQNTNKMKATSKQQ